ncbi:carboxypeptidase-like regulatory domain-containing protein [candidate division KSB1 bacterium]
MKRRCLAVLFALLVASTGGARALTVSGYVVDDERGETMIGVNLLVAGTSTGAATDGNGYFRITDLAAGEYVLRVSYIGYETGEVRVVLTEEAGSVILDEIVLHRSAVQLPEVVVGGKRAEVADPEVETSYHEMTRAAVGNIPTARSDVFRAIKFLPGVEGLDPFSPLYSVRGGDTGENLVLLDGVTIYNPYHFVIGSGIFNLYAVKKVELLVGGFSAEYGGRNSSVLYLTTREGNNRRLRGEIEASISQTRFVVDFPVGEDITMMVSGRTYYDMVSRFLFYMPSYFYDFNASLNWKINRRNRLRLRLFQSRDYMDFSFARMSSYFVQTFDIDLYDDFETKYNNNWNNRAVTAVLKTLISPNAYLQTQLSGSFFSSNNRTVFDFEFRPEETDEIIKLFYQTDINNRIEDINAKSTLSLKLNSANTLKIGAEFSSYFFSNDIRINYFGEGAVSRTPYLAAGFLEDRLDYGPFTFRAGLRLSKFSYDDQTYLEPRLNALVALTDDLTFKAAWGHYYQFINSINSQEYEVSQMVDYYYPLKNRDPSRSTHYIAGLESSPTPSTRLSLDLYYKDISRTYTFDYNLTETEVYNFSDKLVAGSGKAYGLELLWKGSWRRLSGWVSYGLGKSTRSYPHIMEGKSYIFDYDHTHSFKLMVSHQVHPSLSYNGTLMVQSGAPKTLERTVRSHYYYDPSSYELAWYPAVVADVKNNVRLPIQIRLDIGLKKRIRKGFGAELAQFLGADESYMNFTFGNLLFLLHRNVMFYIPTYPGYYGIGSNYAPEISVGYTVKF